MKTITIKTLKKEVLVIELPKNGYCSLSENRLQIRDYNSCLLANIEGYYTLLGSPDEIKEEDAEKLIEKDPWVMSFKSYRDYSSKKGVKYNTLITAIESFNSALEKEILWENPIKIPSSDDINWFRNQRDGDFSERYTRVFDWYNNQEKTFDKKRVKIFVKN